MTVARVERKVECDRSLPQGWRWISLGEICSFIRGVSFENGEVRNTASDEFLPILRAGNISHTLDLINDLVWVPQARISQSQLIQKGDILICMSSGSPKVVGKTAMVKEYWSGSVGAFCGIIRAHDVSMAEYLSFWFRSSGYLDWRDNQTRGANIQNLRFSEFEKLLVPLPPTLAEQERIAGILDEQMLAVEKARTAAEARLEAAKALPAAYLREIFEGEEAKKWAQRKFDEIAVLQRGYDLPFKNKVAGKYPLVTSSGIAGYHNEFKANAPGVVTGRSGSIGKVYYITEDYWPHNTSLFIRDFKGNVPLYIFYFLQWLNTEKVGSGTGVPTLDRKSVHRLTVGYPDIDTQNHIASTLSQRNAEALKIAKIIEKELETINALPVALLRRAFTGGL